MLLSILIPSLGSRRKELSLLLIELEKQIKPFKSEVEILTFVDNKEHSTGFKRQELLHRAKGEYIVFIDDDDKPSRFYIQEMVNACKSGCDCISIEGLITTNGREPIRWKISKDFKDETVIINGRKFYNRHTNHITAVKRSIALVAGFPDKSNAEDSEYSNRLKASGLLKTEYEIKGRMYHYQFSTKNKEYK